MSLTSRLDDRNGPERRFIDACFVVDPAGLKRGLPLPVREQLRTVALAPPQGVSGGGFGTVGTAFDYRVRFSLQPVPVEPLVAHRGAALLVGHCDAILADGTKRLEARSLQDRGLTVDPGMRQALVDEFFASLGRLDVADDLTLTRYCLVLALFEEVFRAVYAPNFDSSLYHLPAGAGLADLLAVPGEALVADVRQLWRGFAETVPIDTKLIVCNPAFDGSGDIGGADADLLLEDCLVELKCSMRSPNIAECLRQLIGYVLLDYSDSYGIRNVAVYSGRHRCLIRFSLRELLFENIDSDGVIVRFSEGAPRVFEERLADLRGHFRELLRLRLRTSGAH